MPNEIEYKIREIYEKYINEDMTKDQARESIQALMINRKKEE
jgi:hypothetical protein